MRHEPKQKAHDYDHVTALFITTRCAEMEISSITHYCRYSTAMIIQLGTLSRFDPSRVCGSHADTLSHVAAGFMFVLPQPTL